MFARCSSGSDIFVRINGRPDLLPGAVQPDPIRIAVIPKRYNPTEGEAAVDRRCDAAPHPETQIRAGRTSRQIRKNGFDVQARTDNDDAESGAVVGHVSCLQVTPDADKRQGGVVHAVQTQTPVDATDRPVCLRGRREFFNRVTKKLNVRAIDDDSGDAKIDHGYSAFERLLIADRERVLDGRALCPAINEKPLYLAATCWSANGVVFPFAGGTRQRAAGPLTPQTAVDARSAQLVRRAGGACWAFRVVEVGTGDQCPAIRLLIPEAGR